MPGLFAGTSLERPVTCAVCGRATDECACPRNAAGDVMLPRDQAARVRREKRRGKIMTVVAGLDAHATDLPALLKDLRRTFAAGGAVHDDGVEIQGDHRDALVALLIDRGYPAKPAGG